MSVKPIPDGHHTVTPYLVLREAAKAIDFYQRAFGAEELFRAPMPNGKIMHARIRIGDSMIMISDEFPNSGCGPTSPQALNGTTTILHLFVPDVDAVMAQAEKAGATIKMPAADQFWGDRYGQLQDPFGHYWSVATHKEDLTPEQVAKRGQEFMSKMAKKN